MKIAQIAPLYESVPPKLYGGTERVVAHLTDALVELGHEVTLFSAGGAATLATEVPCREQALRLDDTPLKSDFASHLSMLHRIRSRADEFDILHFHIDLLHFPFFEAHASKSLTTLHGRLDIADLPQAYRLWNNFPLVSISHNQRLPLPAAYWYGMIHHGLADRHYPLTLGSGEYLAFLGRISVEKSPDRAIQIAIAAGMPLKIAAKVDPTDRAYFHQVIEPMLDHPLIEFLGEIGDHEKGEFLGNARALLFPIDWPEPFGLVMIEAMACGTPVIAWRRGSVPEVIDHMRTGFIVDSMDEAIQAVKAVGLLDRRAIRREFDQRFSSHAMARQYVELYEQLLAERSADPRAEALAGDRSERLTTAGLGLTAS
ncbi:glycosyltransferase family 4 protein [Pseudomonas sp. RIT-PI-S]|uniref:glycosyltransferase family 4 protein n=1 Tax=Pseudomonas sp. RIT-PI-S TaxID=3035295 RepID=UPI0021D936B3|nr:glycosyltransferase family 4 protein [Pseudomonas sp. RIT-PI-S]